MKALLILCSVLILSMVVTVGWRESCEHVYVETVPSCIVIEHGPYTRPIGFPLPYYPSSPPQGLQKGVEIVCVKCNHITNQIIEHKVMVVTSTNGSQPWYGENIQLGGLSTPLEIDTSIIAIPNIKHK